MEFIEGKCPKCQGVLQIPGDREKIICMYCGEEIETAAAVKQEETQKQAESEKKKKDERAYERDYQMAIEGVPKILFNMDQPLVNFKKGLYEGAFRKHYMQHIVTLEAIESVYQMAEDKDRVLNDLSMAVVEKARKELEPVTRKGPRGQKIMHFNMGLVVFAKPTILEYKGESSDPLADRILELWNKEFPQHHVGKATFADINGGFRRKFCYITTAVCESLGKPDDCYELTLLRNYRDQYLANQDGGDAIIKEYYDIAPTIVKRINKRTDRREVYESIWEQYLSPCIKLIEEDKNTECQEIYSQMVRELQKEYLF